MAGLLRLLGHMNEAELEGFRALEIEGSEFWGF